MSDSVDFGTPAAAVKAGGVARAALDPRWAAVALFAVAVAQQAMGHHNADNSWLFTVAESVMGGARPYVDILETNPPASFLLYMPAAWLARAIGASTEFWVTALVFLGGLACVASAARVLIRAGLLPRAGHGFLAVAAVFTLAFLPGFTFAEREHIATIWVLPMLAIHAARMAGAAPSWRATMVAGLLAGLAMAIKPHFALAIALSFAGVFWRRPALKTLFAPENSWAAGVVGIYTAAVFVYFPDFFKALPAIVDAYVPVRVSMMGLLQQPWFVLNVALLIAALLIGGRACLSPRVYPLIAASLGFAGAYFWQGKGWPNHELPSIALLGLALAMLVAPLLAELFTRGESPGWRSVRPVALYAVLPAMICAPVLFGASVMWTNGEEHPGLMAAVRRHAPVKPSIMALSPQLTAGFPLTRRTEGRWVGRAQRLWLTISARMLIAANRGDADYRGQLRDYIEQDTRDFLDDVRARHPDVILVDKDPRVAAAIAEIPALAASLEGYVKAETADDLEVWVPVK